MKKILVTGANGQLGKTIQELYANKNPELSLVFVSKSELDISDEKAVLEIFSKYDFSYCVNCAAYTNVEQAEKTPEIAFKVNGEGVKNLAKVCKDRSIVLIHISTDYVFDGEKDQPYLVSDTTNPINEYGKSKLAGENHIKDILSKYFIIRTSWLYSKSYGSNFYRNILKKAKKEKQLSIITSQLGCPTDTVNLSNYIFGIILKDSTSYGIHHFCDEKTMTWYDFAKQILIENELFDKIKLEKADNYVTFAKRPKYSVLSKTHIL